MNGRATPAQPLTLTAAANVLNDSKGRACGRSAAGAALVLTGESTRAMVDALPHERRPRYVLEGVGQLIPADGT